MRYWICLICCCAISLSGCAPGGPPGDLASDERSAPASVTNERVAAVPGSGGTYRPPPDADGVRALPMVPGRPGRVFIFAALDPVCGTLPAPELTVTRAPAKGEVSFRPGQVTRIASSAGGTCKNAEALGTGVYYTAQEGQRGADSFTVTARLASGETMTRDFAVKIAD